MSTKRKSTETQAAASKRVRWTDVPVPKKKMCELHFRRARAYVRIPSTLRALVRRASKLGGIPEHTVRLFDDTTELKRIEDVKFDRPITVFRMPAVAAAAAAVDGDADEDGDYTPHVKLLYRTPEAVHEHPVELTSSTTVGDLETEARAAFGINQSAVFFFTGEKELTSAADIDCESPITAIPLISESRVVPLEWAMPGDVAKAPLDVARRHVVVLARRQTGASLEVYVRYLTGAPIGWWMPVGKPHAAAAAVASICDSE
jgi:hypothetical protein